MHHFACPHCTQEIDAPAELRGKKATCPHCTQILTRTATAKPPRSTADKLGSLLLILVIILMCLGFVRACSSVLGSASAERPIDPTSDGFDTFAPRRTLRTRQAAESAFLDRTVRDLQSRLPVLIDSSTRLESATIEPDRSVMILYTLLDESMVPDAATLQAQINASYQSPAMKPLRDEHRNLIWRYRNSNGRILLNITNN